MKGVRIVRTLKRIFARAILLAYEIGLFLEADVAILFKVVLALIANVRAFQVDDLLLQDEVLG